MPLTWRDRWRCLGVLHAPLPPPSHPTYDLNAAIRAALEEDSAGIGDVTTLSTIEPQTEAIATFLVKAPGVLSGLAVADEVFAAVDNKLVVEWTAKEGDRVAAGTMFGTVRGSARSLLVAERVALNFMQRMSGIATATAAMMEAVRGSGARVIETRKTAPGLRLLDKWAVLAGGGSNHRIGLFDMAMIKDNHITAAGSITAAVQRCQAYLRKRKAHVRIEVETRTLEEVEELMGIVEKGHAPLVTRVMLDNMAVPDAQAEGGIDVSLLERAVGRIEDQLETEASGNVTLATAGRIARTGVDFISCGALTHSVAALDISLKIQLL